MATRKCPFCAEQIQVDARKCKHCGSDIPAAPRKTHPGTWAALIAMVLMMGMCFVVIQGPPSRQRSPAGATAVSSPPAAQVAEQPHFGPQDFAIVEQWQPHSAAEQPKDTAFGARVVLKRDMSKDELVALVRQLGTGRDPVVIQVFRTTAAYEAVNKRRPTKIGKTGYLLSITARGGRGEIVWMQEKGELAALLGTRTELAFR
jgi:hypothetical protein